MPPGERTLSTRATGGSSDAPTCTRSPTVVLTVKVDRYASCIDTGLAWEIDDPYRRRDDTRIYRFDATLELEGDVTHPKARAGERYRIVVYGRERAAHDFDVTLARCHARDEQGRLRYRTVRGQSAPDYTPPPGIGLLEKVRGIARRKGVVWVPNTFFSQMLTLTIATKPLYLQIGERRAERIRWITRFALMTEEPETDGEE